MGSLVPVKDTAHEGGDEESASLRSGNGLRQREEESQIAVDTMFALKDLGSLDPFPSTGKLDQDAGFINADGFVELIRPVSRSVQSMRSLHLHR